MDVPVAANVLGTLGAVGKGLDRRMNLQRLTLMQGVLVSSSMIPNVQYLRLFNGIDTDLPLTAHSTDCHQLSTTQCYRSPSVDDDALGLGWSSPGCI
jgi:hypothetical protein